MTSQSLDTRKNVETSCSVETAHPKDVILVVLDEILKSTVFYI